MQKTAAQVVADLLAELEGLDDDGPNFRSVRAARALAKQALALLDPAPAN